MDKLKIGFYSLSSCSGCQLMILTQSSVLFELSDRMDIKAFRAVKSDTVEAEMDIAIVEGSIGCEEDKARAEEIRRSSKKVIALGACATHGGVQSRPGNSFVPLGHVIDIDDSIRGCPVDPDEFATVMIGLVIGKEHEQRETSVCMECREKNNSCIIEHGGVCLGPSSYSGCKAVCPSNRTWCLACRGLTKDSNMQALEQVFRQGRDMQQIWNFFGGKHDKH